MRNLVTYLALLLPLLLHGKVTVVGNDALVQKAASVLEEELALRGRQMDITVGLESEMDMPELALLEKTGPEGFKIKVLERGGVVIAGADARGVLYGVGMLLRMKEMTELSSTPRNRYRVQNLNDNPRYQNQCDEGNLATFDRRVRDLALFGTNGIQVWRRTPEPFIDIIKSWGLDVWIMTYVNAKPEVIASGEGYRKELDYRRHLIGNLSHIDHYVMKSGDPGSLDIDEFFRFSADEALILKSKFPDAKIWIAPQHYSDAPVEYFEKACKYSNEAVWVDGVMASCWTRFPAREIRERISSEKEVMQGPDITHIYSDMCPARNMDYALAKSLGRICINISPLTQKHIHNLADPYCEGNLCYSEGTTDDLHKCLWSALDWNPDADAEELVREYARLFIPGVDADKFAEGVMAIEHNAIGPLEQSDGMLENLDLWRRLEKESGSGTASNIRFLMPYLRAVYDSYIYKRWTRDLPLEQKCYDLLAEASSKPGKVMDNVCRLLEQTFVCVDAEHRKECMELYRRVYKDKDKWLVQNQENPLIAQIDEPLVDSGYILDEFERIRTLATDREVLEALNRLGVRFRSHPGVVYFNLGDFSTETVTGIDAGWESDPIYLSHPVRMYGCKANRFTINGNTFAGKPAPRAWLVQAGIYYDQPMVLTFNSLEPGANYKVRITYAGEVAKYPVHTKLTMNGKMVHRPLLVDREIECEYNLPFPASVDGTITLRWESNYGERGVAVAEITFVKQ